MDAFKSMLYNNGYPLYVYNDASDVDLKRRGTKKDPGAMKLIIKKMPAPDATNDGGAEDGKTVDELFLAFGGTLTSRWILGLASRLLKIYCTTLGLQHQRQHAAPNPSTLPTTNANAPLSVIHR